MELSKEDLRLLDIANDLISLDVIKNGITVTLRTGGFVQGRLRGGVQFNNPIVSKLPPLTGDLEVYVEDAIVSIPLDNIDSIRPTY